jgi:hypothetical protein
MRLAENRARAAARRELPDPGRSQDLFSERAVQVVAGKGLEQTAHHRTRASRYDRSMTRIHKRAIQTGKHLTRS